MATDMIETEGKPRWYGKIADNDRLVCGLCGMRIPFKSRFSVAVWHARGGYYAQTLHGSCARIVRYWGRQPQFDEPREAEAWVRETGCVGCEKALSCDLFAFKCRRALTRTIQAGIYVGENQDEDVPEGFMPRWTINGAYLPDHD